MFLRSCTGPAIECSSSDNGNQLNCKDHLVEGERDSQAQRPVNKRGEAADERTMTTRGLC